VRTVFQENLPGRGIRLIAVGEARIAPNQLDEGLDLEGMVNLTDRIELFDIQPDIDRDRSSVLARGLKLIDLPCKGQGRHLVAVDITGCVGRDIRAGLGIGIRAVMSVQAEDHQQQNR